MIIPFRYKACIFLVSIAAFACVLWLMIGLNDIIFAAIPEYKDTAFFYVAVYSAAISWPIGVAVNRLVENLTKYAYSRIDRHAKMMMSQWLSNHLRQKHPGQFKRGDNVNITMSFTIDEWKIIRNIA